MDLTFEESLPLIFYSFFALIILALLVLTKSGSKKLAADKTVETEKLLCRQNKFPDIGVLKCRLTGKHRNRHRNHRDRLQNDQRGTASGSAIALLPNLTIEKKSPISTLFSNNTSCPSVYFSDTSPQESEANFVTVHTEEVVRHDAKPCLSLGSNDDTRAPSISKEEPLLDPSGANSSEVCKGSSGKPGKCNTIAVTGQEEDCASKRNASSLYPAVENRTETCRQKSDRQHIPTTQRGVQEMLGLVREEQAEVKPGPSYSSTSSDDEDLFHIARPALPTTIASSGVCIDSFAEIDVCSPVQKERTVCYPVQNSLPHFGLPKEKTSGKPARKKKKLVKTKATLEAHCGLKTPPIGANKSKRPTSKPKSRSRSSSRASSKRPRSTENEKFKPKKTINKTKGAKMKRSQKKKKTEKQLAIKEATREVVAARIAQAPGSKLYSPVPASANSRTSDTDGTSVLNTSTWA
ncbi:hypothetical protein ElyMa_004933500 [Elysia marginata]|uniref:Uncharacterized protein n=1 Tax=Elysia marginata TaxID=1093978 RepID=A0AAV4IYD5_9GAST|nr:hypothetical protein ElyMa_004933500 [Elysia marginata]